MVGVIFLSDTFFQDFLYSPAVCFLKKQGVDAQSLVYGEQSIPPVVQHCARRCEKVLFVIHGRLHLNALGQCIADNVYIYEGTGLTKNMQYKLLEKYNIPVPPWMFMPKSLDEVFNLLGDDIIAKPLDIGASCRKGIVHFNRTNPSSLHLDNYIFQKYIGELCPPYWKARVVAMFGHIICTHCFVSQESELIGGGLDGKEMPVCYLNRTITRIGLQAAAIFSQETRTAMVAIDIAGQDNDYYVLEVNSKPNIREPATTNLRYSNLRERIAGACMKQLEQLK